MRWVILLVAYALIITLFGGGGISFVLCALAYIVILQPGRRTRTKTTVASLGLIKDQFQSPANAQMRADVMGVVPQKNPDQLEVKTESASANTSTTAEQSPPFRLQPKKIPIRRMAWIVIGSTALLALGLVTYFTVTEQSRKHNQPDDVQDLRDNDVFVRNPQNVHLWYPDQCEDDNFPEINNTAVVSAFQQTELGRINVNIARLYCSQQWDREFFHEAASLISNRHVSIGDFLNYPSTPQDAYSEFSPDVADFYRVLQAGPLILRADDPDFMKSAPTNMQRHIEAHIDDLRYVRQYLARSTQCGAQYARPVPYLVRPNSPQVYLISDIGLHSTLNQIIRQISSTSQYKDGIKEAMPMARLLPDSRDDNLLATLVRISLTVDFLDGLAARREMFSEMSSKEVFPQLPDLTIYYLKSEQPNGREGGYDPASGVIEVHTPDLTHFENDPQKEETARIVLASLPVYLIHEFYHYLLFQPKSAAIGFTNEGPVTAFAERSRQLLVGGATLTKRDPLYGLSRKLLGNTLNGSDSDWEAYDRLAAERLRGLPFTSLQCHYFHRVAALNSIPIGNLLTLTQSMFEAQDDVDLTYSEAWAVYQTNIVEHRRWAGRLQAYATKVNAGLALTEEENIDLENMSRATLKYVQNTNAEGLSCTNEKGDLTSGKR